MKESNDDFLFILIDDDPSNNIICSINIRKVFKHAEIVSFELPLEGLEYLLSLNEKLISDRNVVLLLDINMPILSGFDVLDQMQNAANKDLLYKIKTYILSSSIDPKDKEISDSYEITSGYIEKPITIEIIEKMFS